VLLTGGAGLRFDRETDVRELRPGDYLHIPAHARHRVEWTHPSEPTVWLAVHIR
jgi:cupin 2 domain-containing protein